MRYHWLVALPQKRLRLTNIILIPNQEYPFLECKISRLMENLHLTIVSTSTKKLIGLLQRSQVAEGDLLVKITGVGRMAVASVAPKDFIGNTNQHMVVIKTGDASISYYVCNG